METLNDKISCYFAISMFSDGLSRPLLKGFFFRQWVTTHRLRTTYLEKLIDMAFVSVYMPNNTQRQAGKPLSYHSVAEGLPAPRHSDVSMSVPFSN